MPTQIEQLRAKFADMALDEKRNFITRLEQKVARDNDAAYAKLLAECRQQYQSDLAKAAAPQPAYSPYASSYDSAPQWQSYGAPTGAQSAAPSWQSGGAYGGGYRAGISSQFFTRMRIFLFAAALLVFLSHCLAAILHIIGIFGLDGFGTWFFFNISAPITLFAQGIFFSSILVYFGINHKPDDDK